MIDKKERSCIIVDIAVPVNGRVHDKEREKVEKYQDLRREIGIMWQLRMVQAVPVHIERWIEIFGIPGDLGVIQKTGF